jgi:NADH-quinone oxidoreductase subunit H
MITLVTALSMQYIKVDIINILIILDFILIGGILPFLERKKLSLIQRRVGPKYIGLNGRLQFIADSLKIFLKDYIYIFKSNKYIYFILPIFYLYINIFFIYNFQ